MESSVLTAESLTFGYAGKALLPALDIKIRDGEFWAVIGRNGSGKTTLFRTLLGLQSPVGGRVTHGARWRPAYIPQRAGLDPIVPLRAIEVVSLGEDRDWSFLRFSGKPRRMRALACLREAGAEELYDRQFHELSEGQKQRVMLARMLAGRATVAFLDEPTAAMDSVAERESMELIDRLRHEHGIAVVMVSHFLGVARDVADRVLFLDRELQSVIAGTPAEVFESPVFRRRYGDGVDR